MANRNKQPEMERRLAVRRICLAVCVAAVALLIFCFSTQNGTASSKTSGFLVRRVASIVAPDLNTWPEAEQRAYLSNLQHIIRKAAHFSEYAALGFFVYLLLRQYREKAWLATAVLCAAYAAADELHQFLSPGRSPQLLDVLIDTSGAVCSASVLFLIELVIRHRRRSRNG